MKKIICLLFAALLIGCSPKKEAPSEKPPILKISVNQAGTVLANGNEVSIAELNAELSDLKSQTGVVWYYREAGQEKPPTIAGEVISSLIEYQLPISVSSKPDFSDVIDQDGQSRPRK
jgi:hypothetical protein